MDKYFRRNAMAATTLALDSGSQLEVRGAAPISVAREVWLAPHFVTKCPGDSDWVAAGDKTTHDGVCPWERNEPFARPGFDFLKDA